jgi:hypothetical protein
MSQFPAAGSSSAAQNQASSVALELSHERDDMLAGLVLCAQPGHLDAARS